MPIDFDRIIDRRHTRSYKWDRMSQSIGLDAPDAIPMWVADMDFEAPLAVRQALHQRCRARHLRIMATPTNPGARHAPDG